MLERGLGLVFLVACSSAPASSYVGQYCGYPDRPSCGGGTQCMVRIDIMTLSYPDGGTAMGCSGMERICSLPCATDTDCTSALGAGFRCETRCSEIGAHQCVATDQ